ncbi:MAG: IS30 family transposase [Acidimicrobiia bacterium]|nr:IS30 family transposase [Acidimicrobiia bacterium]
MPGSRLCLVEREEIRVGIERGWSLRRIASHVGRAASTISREVARHGGRARYRAVEAHRRAGINAARPKPTRLSQSPQLAAQIRGWLEAGWSPAPIAQHLATLGTPISAETIYRACYRTRSPLGDDAWQLLNRRRRSKRRRRRTRTGQDHHPLGQFRLITQRGDITTRAGHWEGDLIIGAGNRSAAVVLTERHSRLVKVGALTSQRADHVAAVVTRLLTPIPPPLRRTLTWDQGRELARWSHLETQLGLEVFFCRPRSPWEKPLVENTCNLLRRWLPRHSNLYRPQPELDHYATLLNTMPRRSLNWNTAQHEYDQLRVATTS